MSACHRSLGIVRLEPDEGALRALLGLGDDEAPTGEDPPDGGHRGDDEAPTGEDPPDGGHRGDGETAPLLEVVGDGVGPGVQALIAQLLAQEEDRFLHRLWGPVGTPPRPP